jgi:hypothetical protein
MQTTKCLLEKSEYWVPSVSIHAPYSEDDFANAQEQCPSMVDSMKHTNTQLVDVPLALLDLERQAYETWRWTVKAIYAHCDKEYG